jgi:hypothetical protein
MKLYMVDYLLSVCRLLYAQLAISPIADTYPIWQDGEPLNKTRLEMQTLFYQHRDNAEKLVAETGYHRRDAELKSIKNLDITAPKILPIDSPKQPRPDWLPPFVNKLPDSEESL